MNQHGADQVDATQNIAAIIVIISNGNTKSKNKRGGKCTFLCSSC